MTLQNGGHLAAEAATEGSQNASKDYAKFMYETVLGWYRTADTKAQIILATSGIFLGFIASTVFGKRSELDEKIASFGYVSWILLALMALSMVVAIICAITCLWSNTMSDRHMAERRSDYIRDDLTSGPRAPEEIWFFQDIAKAKHGELDHVLSQVNERFLIRALSFNSIVLSKRVVFKHKLINYGFLSVGTSLILFILTSVAYILRI